MERKNLIENATIAISMVTRLMNARRNQNLKENVTNARNKVTSHPSENQNHSI